MGTRRLTSLSFTALLLAACGSDHAEVIPVDALDEAAEGDVVVDDVVKVDDRPDVVSPDVASPDVQAPRDAAVDAPAIDVARDAAALDAPDAAVDRPSVDAPTIDAPVIDRPVIDAPTVDAVTVDAPSIDAPTPDAPVADVVSGDVIVVGPTLWSTNATDHDCRLDGVVGLRFSYTCPPDGTFGSLWGTGVYTHDSSICTAAVHAGRITRAAGGTVVIEMRPAADSYVGSTRNGATSSMYGAWYCSYAVVSPGCGSLRVCGDVCADTASDLTDCGACGVSCAAGQMCTAGRCVTMCPTGQISCADRCVDATTDRANCGACGRACATGETCTAGVCGAATITWSTNATDHDCSAAGVVGSRYSYVCPPGGSAGAVWGTDVYTHDSSICTAAVHAGRATLAGGGAVVIEMRPGQSSYEASTRNGVTSYSYPAWGCSYAFP